MNAEEIKKVVREAYNLINTVHLVYPIGIDFGFNFVSEDERFHIRFRWEDEYKLMRLNEKTMMLEDAGVTLDELDAQGVQWEFTQGAMDLLEDIVLDAREHIQQHERDIEKFSSMVDKLSGEMILGCL